MNTQREDTIVQPVPTTPATSAATAVRTPAPGPLSGDQVEQFTELGYLVLPGFLPDGLVDRLKPEVDRWVDEGLRSESIARCTDPTAGGPPPVLELELAAHGELLSHPPLMAVLEQLTGSAFVFHHMHSDRQAPDVGAKPWHHDYEQRPQTDRTHTMIHTLHYLDGLDRRTAALAVLPGSHREVADKAARAHHGAGVLPGEVVIDRLPKGSTVVLHSALFHARRPMSSGGDRPRYMVDTSYCAVGVRWPPVKPYWRHMLRRGRELGLDHGRWPELFADHHFSDYVRP